MDKAEQEDAHASLHWTLGNEPFGAIVEGERVYQRASGLYHTAQKLMEVEKLSKTMLEFHAQVAERTRRDSKAAIQKHNDNTHVRSQNVQVGDYVPVADIARAVRPSYR
jgi:hypothetical protein